MKKIVNFDLPVFFKGVEKKSVDIMSEVKRFDRMVEELIAVGVSALDFELLTADNLEQYRSAHTDNHDCTQLIHRIQSLPSTKLEEYNILF